MSKTHLVISEMFKSIQGEGNTIGIPSYFIRLAQCNLECGFSKANLAKARKENWSQDKMKDNMLKEATWICDSMAVWMKGGKYTWEGIINHLGDFDFLKSLKDGAHLVITGGEPLAQQEGIVAFLQYLEEKYNIFPTCEVETNATIKPNVDMVSKIDFWNLSPKLSNSGMPEKRRLIPEVIKFFNNLPARDTKVMFKFVVNTDADIKEVVTDWMIPFKIPHTKVRFMPGADNREDLIKVEQWLVEKCKDLNIPFTTRFHIHHWNKKTGV